MVNVNLKPTATNIILLLVFVVFVIVVGPLATIASLNALFPALNIPMNFLTWCSALWLGALLSGGLSSKK